MAKNAVDAHRKALRKKEVAKNKQDRKKAREISVVKKDTRSLEADIRKLSGAHSAADKEELASLRAELARINKAKQEYVEAHPEHRKFVFPERAGDKDAAVGAQADPPGLYGRDGKLKHPERSLYYDPVFNPFGAPPPGMPYRERPPTMEEMAAFQPVGAPMDEDEDSDDGEDDDDDIVMPAGPPPGSDDSSDDSDDSDDIQMPAGPPPPPKPQEPTNRVAIARPQRGPGGQGLPHRPQFAQPFHPDPHMRHIGGPPPFRPPPPFGAPQGPRNPHLPARPAPPPTHDPLADGPKPTFQSFQQARQQAPPSAPSGPSLPTDAPPPPPPAGLPAHFASTAAGAGATISAAPVLRDLKAEATAFLPSHMRKKKAPPAPGASAGLSTIDAARGAEGAPPAERASLMGALKDAGIGAATMPTPPVKTDKGAKDYEKFQREMEGFL